MDDVDAVVVLGAAPDAGDDGRGVTGCSPDVFVALQMLSSIYYGVFLGTLLGVCGVLLLIVAAVEADWWPSIKALMPGALLAVAASAARTRCRTWRPSQRQVAGRRSSSWPSARVRRAIS